MRSIFGKKSEKLELLQQWGCLSSREGDFVIVAGESNGNLLLSRLPRKASLETLRLAGRIRTTAPNYHARMSRLEALRFEGEVDEVMVGLGYLDYLKKQNFNLKDRRVAFTFDETGTVTSNSAREKDVTEAQLSVEGFRGRVDASCPVEIESRGRAVLRLFLHQNVAVDAEDTTVCAVLAEDNGYSISFWNSDKGICWEAENGFTETLPEDNFSAIADEIKRLITKDSLESLGLDGITRMVLVAGPECRDFLSDELGEDDISFENIQFVEGTHYQISEGSQSLKGNLTDAVIAAGLCVSDPRVPPINLNLDLEEELRHKAQEQVIVSQRHTTTTNRNLTLLLVAPVLFVVACLFIFYVSLYLKDGYAINRQEVAKAKEVQLQATISELDKVKKSADQVQVIGKLIETLRKRQPANFTLLMTLNRIFPSGGAAWQIDEITSKPDGTVTIKGKTTSDESLADFVKNLDFSEDFESVKASKDETAATAGLVDNGVKKFAVEARYLPLVAAAKPAPAAVVPPVTAAPVQGMPKQPNS